MIPLIRLLIKEKKYEKEQISGCQGLKLTTET